MTDTNKMRDPVREQFEAWAERENKWLIDRDSFGNYIYGFVRDSWASWQASRQAVVVELPEIKNQDWACGSSECEAMRHGITLSKHAINAAGIKTIQRMQDVRVPERTCQGCGAKGWTANCNECIPY